MLTFNLDSQNPSCSTSQVQARTCLFAQFYKYNLQRKYGAGLLTTKAGVETNYLKQHQHITKNKDSHFKLYLVTENNNWFKFYLGKDQNKYIFISINFK